MPIDSIPVGSNQRQVVTIGDQSVASQYEAVLPVADAINTTGKSAGLVLASPALLNSGGNLDRQRAAPGTTGVPSVSIEGTKTTFSTASLDFTPVTTATDIWTLLGSGTKTVRLLRLTITGFATAAISVNLQLIVRSTADSGGTSSTPALVPHDTNGSPSATAVVNLYSVNPTLGTSVGPIRARKLNLGATGSAGTVEWNFSDKNDQAPVLRGATQQLCLNWNGAAVPAGTLLDIEAEFTEE